MSCNCRIQRESFARTAEQIRGINRKARIICGGQDVTRDPHFYKACCDKVYTGSDLKKLGKCFEGGSAVIDGGFGDVLFPDLGLKFAGKGVETYTTSTEGPLPLESAVIPLKMSAGCGRNCESCRYPYKNEKLIFNSDKVKDYLDHARKYGRVLLVTDEITNLPLEKTLDAIRSARDLGFFLDYGNTLSLPNVAEYDETTSETLFGRDSFSGCIGACTSFSLKAFYDDGYRQKVMEGFEKINSSGVCRFSVNLAVGRHGTEENIAGVCESIFKEMRSAAEKPVLFNIYFLKSQFFMLPENPTLGNFARERLDELNDGPLIDQKTGNYRYLF